MMFQKLLHNILLFEETISPNMDDTEVQVKALLPTWIPDVSNLLNISMS